MARSNNPSFFIYAAFLLFQLPVHASYPLIALRLAEVEVETATIGIVLGIAGIIPALVALPSGQLTDRIGSSRQAAFSSIASAAGFVGLTLVSTPLLVGVFLTLLGLGHTIGVVAYQSFVASSETVTDRVQAFGWLAAIIAIAQSIGPAGAGFVADRFTLTTVFGIGAALMALSVLGAPMLRLNRSKILAPGIEAPQLSAGWWRESSLPFAVIATLLFSLSYNVRLSYYPLYLDNIGLSTTQIGVIFSVQALSSLLIRSRIGKLVTWLGQRTTLIVFFAGSVPALAIIPLLSSYSLLMVDSIALGLGNGVMHPVTMAAAIEAVPRERHGTALGVRYAIFRFGSAISPLLLAGAVAIMALPGAFLLSAALSSVGAVTTWRNRHATVYEKYVEV